jgi:hypothetical protein
LPGLKILRGGKKRLFNNLREDAGVDVRAIPNLPHNSITDSCVDSSQNRSKILQIEFFLIILVLFHPVFVFFYVEAIGPLGPNLLVPTKVNA